VPDAPRPRAHRVEIARREHALRTLGGDVLPRPRALVAALDQQPLGLALGGALHAQQHPAALQLLAAELELETAAPQAVGSIAPRLPGAAIPHQHRAAAVLAFRDDAFEVAVLERMVFDLDREAAFGGSRLGPLGTAQLLSTPSSSSRKS
jgi:hypothetical protein